MPDQPASVARRSRRRTAFDNKEMDDVLRWLLGREVHQGSPRAECRKVASRTADGDPVSWLPAWILLAEKIEQIVQERLNTADHEAAPRASLQACTYHRDPMFIMYPANPLFDAFGDRMRHCFRQATSLSSPPSASLEVGFRGLPLPGRFWPPDDSQTPRPTLIVIGGFETFVEDCNFMIGTAPRLRGYNLLTVEPAGQGFNPAHGLVYGAQRQEPVHADLDYACARPEVDPARLAPFGLSWGGHVALKAGEHDDRVRALIANPPMPDILRTALGQQGGQNSERPGRSAGFRANRLLDGLADQAQPQGNRPEDWRRLRLPGACQSRRQADWLSKLAAGRGGRGPDQPDRRPRDDCHAPSPTEPAAGLHRDRRRRGPLPDRQPRTSESRSVRLAGARPGMTTQSMPGVRRLRRIQMPDAADR